MGPMAMPWNTIDVPLVTGWQCTLMPECQYEKLMEWGDGYADFSARWLYPRAESDEWDSIWNASLPSDSERAELWDEARLRQLAEDQGAFARLFHPDWDLRTISGGKALRDIKTFLRDSLNIAHWNMPEDNADIRRILCKAVADRRLIPIIDRDYEGLSRVALPDPAPLRWPTTGSGGGSYSGGGGYGFAPGVIGYDEFVALRRSNDQLANALSDSASAGISAVIEPLPSLGIVASGGGGIDWLGAAETVAGAILGAVDGEGGASVCDESFTGDVADDSTPLGNAQPFDYQPDMPDGDVDELAGMPFNGEPGTWISSMPGTMPQMRQFGPSGTPLTDFDFEAHHGNPNPHVHNWDGYNRDEGAPVSLLPW
jgi:hypothetical protein